MFYAETGITLVTTSSYHPQANEIVERFHRFIKEALRASQTLSSEEFSAKLPWVLFAYRTTYHEGIKEIPFFVAHGFDARMPNSQQSDTDVDHKRKKKLLSKEKLTYARYHALKVHEHIAEVKEYIYAQRTDSMKKMKRLYDGPRTDFRFQKGDYVLVWDHRKRTKLRVSKSL
jgi:iron uptake system EfeUOB component EfeO/EfeM